MTEPASPPARRRGMTSFYLAMGALLALAAAFAFAWTPLRVWYWEKEFMGYVRAVPADTPVSFHIWRPNGGRMLIGTAKEGTEALGRLIELGPAAASAIERALSSLPADRQMRVMDCLAEAGEAWTVRALVSSVRGGKPYLVREALDTAERVTGQVFFPNGPRSTRNPNPPIRAGEWTGRAIQPAELEVGRERFLAWWESEGQAKYGGGEK